MLEVPVPIEHVENEVVPLLLIVARGDFVLQPLLAMIKDLPQQPFQRGPVWCHVILPTVASNLRCGWPSRPPFFVRGEAATLQSDKSILRPPASSAAHPGSPGCSGSCRDVLPPPEPDHPAA